MVGVSKKSGCATPIMIVVTIVTNQHTCVVKEIVPLAGNVVQVMLTTVAYQNGSSVTEKMIVAMVRMNFLRIVPSATPKWNSNALIIDVYLNNGFATLLTIVGMVVMKLKQCARTVIENVQSLSSGVIMASVLPPDGDAILKMIVAIIVMRMVVKSSCVKMIHSNVQVVIA